jgi:hypothetical protein
MTVATVVFAARLPLPWPIEAWAAKQPDKPRLSKAIRRLVEFGLKHQR